MNHSFAAKLGSIRAKDLSRYANALEGVHPPENLIRLTALMRAQYDDDVNIEAQVELWPVWERRKQVKGKKWIPSLVSFALGVGVYWLGYWMGRGSL